MMATLYELTEEYRQLLELAEDEDEDPEVIADTLEGLEGEIEIKAEGYAKVIRQLEYDAAALKAEEKRLGNRRKTIEGNISRLKRSLFDAMNETGKRKFKTDLFSFGIQKNPHSVAFDGGDIPEKYLVPQPPTIDRRLMLDDLKKGVDLTGVAHLEQTESLRIR